jgi:hypothetical protein
MERATEIFAVIQLGMVGLSHLLAPKTWVAFFTWLREKGEAGVFVVAFLSLSFGAIIVAFHPVWTGLPVALTLFGWAQVLKAFVYFLFPRAGLKGMARVSPERTGDFIVAGLLLLGLTGLLAFHLWTTTP